MVTPAEIDMRPLLDPNPSTEHAPAFVKALLDCDKHQAREAYSRPGGRYPIVLTRDLKLAKDWVRSCARGVGALWVGRLLQSAAPEAPCH